MLPSRPWWVALAAIVFVAGCADDAPSTTAPSTTAPSTTSVAGADVVETVRVQTLDNSFRPQTVEVVAGSEIVWTNDGRNEHDVTPADASEDWGVPAERFEPGSEYRSTFTEPGEYLYYCSIHGTATAGQVGTIVVTPPSSG